MHESIVIWKIDWMTDWLVHVHSGYRSLLWIYVSFLNLRGLILVAPDRMFVILKIKRGGEGVIGFPEPLSPIHWGFIVVQKKCNCGYCNNKNIAKNFHDIFHIHIYFHLVSTISCENALRYQKTRMLLLPKGFHPIGGYY